MLVVELRIVFVAWKSAGKINQSILFIPAPALP